MKIDEPDKDILGSLLKKKPDKILLKDLLTQGKKKRDSSKIRIRIEKSEDAE